MYKVGDYVVYGKGGVYTVKEVGHLKIPGIDASRLYYTLTSVYTAETVYTPVDTPIFMRPVITGEEAIRLIRRIPAIEAGMEVQVDVGSRGLPDYYKSLLGTHDCTDLIRLIITVYSRTRRAEQVKKKVCQTDQSFMRDAEEILYGELAVALGIPRKSVSAFIESVLQGESDAAVPYRGFVPEARFMES